MLCTVPDQTSGEQIALALVEEKLAACVNLVPNLVSIYRWEGKVEKAAECLLVIKTRAAHFEAVRAKILALHSYDIPEIVALPITAGSEDYLNWITENSQ